MKVSEQIARRVASNIAYLEDMYAQDPSRATGEIKSIVDTELEPVMEVLNNAIGQSGHAPGCTYRNSYPWDVKNCNCWVSRAEKLIDKEKS